MTTTIDTIPLLRFLEARNPSYHSRALELRETVADWLSYVPATFPHYTRHTVYHSDEILRQISLILFNENLEPAVESLSSAEVYVMVAAAYLHDIGLVVSDSEKQRILRSSDWERWTAHGGGTKRWDLIKELRASDLGDDTVRHFLADLQMRHLIAEFVRRYHHQRSADLLVQYEGDLAGFSFGDPMLKRTIADVCLSHGLGWQELDDPSRYPNRRDIRGERVNPRFAAILLRLGDLLDMSTDRACPLLLNAASPVPADSLAHWTQYQRITHRLTAPDRIEVHAECANEKEHRFLRDWCDWLLNELAHARVLLPRSERHGDWQPPVATLEGDNPTISIEPAEGATYIPFRWRFELDSSAVMQRLIHDLQSEKHAFLRELLQNAADATRCKMYENLRAAGRPTPEFPSKVDQKVRRHHVICVRLQSEDRSNELSGEVESRQVLSVEDHGVGMDNMIIQNYLLQIGKSYYVTPQFRESYGFAPTSRFGVGFLSCFQAADEITIETFKPTSPHEDRPLRLRLTGPRSYLVTEVGERRDSGTRVDLLLKTPFEPGEVLELVRHWCKRLEFPVVVEEDGQTTYVHAETPDQFLREESDPSHEEARFVVRAFPVTDGGVFGELYILARKAPEGESWTTFRHAAYSLRNEYPQFTLPGPPANLMCFHGINLSGHSGTSYKGTSARLDIRSERLRPSLTRVGLPVGLRSLLDELVGRWWDSLIQEHLSTTALASGPDQWRYKQQLSREAGSREYWRDCPGTVNVYDTGRPRLHSLKELNECDTIRVVAEYMPHVHARRHDVTWEELHRSECEAGGSSQATTLLRSEMLKWSEESRTEFLSNRSLVDVGWLTGKHLWYDFRLSDSPDVLATIGGHPLLVADIPDPLTIGFSLDLGSGRNLIRILNRSHAFVDWVIQVCQAAQDADSGITAELLERLLSLLETSCGYQGLECERLQRFTQNWRATEDVTVALGPQVPPVTPRSFIAVHPDSTVRLPPWWFRDDSRT